ncbi:MAG TPA: TonB-dependent receptor [Candidatus Acidoferrales bacterium]|nr:TonB-dependent receptor [Candidatus Acidoferrales bacterium]
MRFLARPARAMLLLCVLTFAAAASLRAQGGPTGAITGTVLDPTHAAIPGASIQIIDATTGQLARSLATSASGSFTASLLPPSTYTVVVNAAGFGRGEVAGVQVKVTEVTTIAITLQPQALQQKVVVTAQVLNVDTENPTTGQVIGTDVVRNLPLPTQNFQQLLTLSAGAESKMNNATQLGRGDVKIFVNGQREDNNNYEIEGISASDYNLAELTDTPLPSPDVVQEFRTQTSLYDASQGRNGGGNINVVLKSGTDQWHWDAFEFFRNDVLNANDFFLNRQGASRPVLKQNIFGGSAGGPLGAHAALGYIFANYQGTRQRSGESNGAFISTVFPVVPTDRSQTSISQAFFGNASTPIDPVVLKLLNLKGNQFCGGNGGFLIPSIPGAAGSSAPFVCSRPGTFTDDQFSANWDRGFHHDRDKFAARFFFSNADTLEPFGAGGLTVGFGGSISRTDLNFPLDLPVDDRFLNTSWTHTFSGAMVNQFRFGYVRINDDLNNVPVVTAADLGINRPTNNVTSDIYKFTFGSSGFQIGPTPQANQTQLQNNFVFQDTFSWIHGNHAVRFGGEYDPVFLDKQFPQVFNGQLFFVNTPASGATPALTDWQNFLTGAAQFSFGASGVFNHAYRLNNYSVFAQDDYKLRRDLTLNLGLRVEIDQAWYDNDCHIGNTFPNLLLQGQDPFVYPKCVNQFKLAGLAGTLSPTTHSNDYSTGLGPRIGFAYDVLGHHTTSLRGGYGIYYVREDVGAVDQLSFNAPFLPVVFSPGPPGSFANFFQPNAPPPIASPNPNALPPGGTLSAAFVPVISQLTGFADASGNPTGDTSQFPVYNNNSINLFGLEDPPHFLLPNVQQWNLTLQRQLPKRWLVEIGYLGTHTVHLRETRDSLQAVIATPQNPLVVTGAGGQKFTITQTTLANALARTPFQGLNAYGGFEFFGSDAYSHYHALNATLSRDWTGGYFQGAYTYSRCTDATSSGNTAFDTAFDDQTNLNGSRGLCDYDRQHRFIVSYLYKLPFFAHDTGAKGRLLGGWAFSGITTVQSGIPFTIIDSGGGTAYDAPSTIIVGASLASGATLASGLTSGSIGSRLDHYVNFNAFQPAPVIGGDGLATGFGTLGRNIYRGPYEQNWDLSLIKDFPFAERYKLRFTADFFDVWNHPAFGAPSFTDVESPSNFGQIISTENNPRIVQFSLRLSY